MGCACEHNRHKSTTSMGLFNWNEDAPRQIGGANTVRHLAKRKLALTPIASLRGLEGDFGKKPRKQAPQAYALLPEYANDVIEEAQLDVAPMMLEGEAFGDEATVYDASFFMPGGLTGLSADAAPADDAISKFEKIRSGVASSAAATIQAMQKPVTSITITGPGGNQPVKDTGTPWEKYALIAGAIIAGVVVVKALMKR